MAITVMNANPARGSYSILLRNATPDGTPLQLEDWTAVYPNSYKPYTVAAYPKAATDGSTPFSPRRGHTFRAGFSFGTLLDAERCMLALMNGTAALRDYSETLDCPENKSCLP